MPMRKCIGCQQSKPQNELMRFVVKDNDIYPDIDRTSPGRGYYLCRSEECLKKSIKRKAWNRIFKRNVDTDIIQRAVTEALNSN